jgi:4-amino-4-deoxy-L-arabinose transferase-like glycosyltransferase
MNSENKILVWIAWSFLLLFSLFYKLSSPLLRAEEPRRASISYEMMMNGDLLHPTINETPYINKPFVFNAAQAVSFKWFGVSEWSARLPSTLFFILTAALIAFMGRWFGYDRTLIASVMYLSLADLVFYGSMNAGEMDLFFTFFVLLTIIGVIGVQRENRNGFILCWIIGVVMGFLTKGVPALAFGALTVLSFRGFWRKWWLYAGAGMVVLAGIYGYFNHYNQYADGWAYFMNLIHETGEKAESRGIWQNGWITVPVSLLKGSLPFGLLLLVRHIPIRRFPNYLIIIFAINLIPYLLSGTVKDRYLYPFLPLLALFLSFILVDGKNRFKSWPWEWVFIGLILSASTLVIVRFNPIVFTFFLTSSLLIPFLYLGWNSLQSKSLIAGVVLVSSGLFLFKSVYKETVLQHRHETTLSYYYKTEVAVLANEIGEEPVIYYGKTNEYNGIVPVLKKEYHLENAPLLPYQVVWEWCRLTNRTLPFKEDIRHYKGYIITTTVDAKRISNGIILHQFEDRWLNRQLALVLKPN